MTTDSAIIYKTKLIKVTSMLKSISELGFDVSNYLNEIDSINEGLERNVSVSKKKTFEGLLISDYTNATNRLTSLEVKLDSYNIYLRANSYVLYIENNEITKENILDIINDLKTIVKGIRNSSVVDYKDEEKIIEKIYKVIYKVIKEEIRLLDTSSLLDYTLDSEIDSIYLMNQVQEEIKSLNLDKYPSIRALYYSLLKDGDSTKVVNASLIKEIIYKDSREELVQSVKDNAEELVSNINLGESKITGYSNNKTCAIDNLTMAKKVVKECYFKLFKKIIALIISLSIPVGLFVALKNAKVIKKDCTEITYDLITEEYNSFTDEIIESKREVVEDDTFDPISVKYYDYSNILTNIFGQTYRVEDVYDLEFLNYDNIEDYMKYVEEDHKLEKDSSQGLKLAGFDNPVYEDVDYYRIVYEYVDMASKRETLNMENYMLTIGFCSFMGSLLLFLFNTIFIYDDKSSTYKNLTCLLKNRKDDIKSNQKKILELNKLLLEEVGKSEELRRKFNEEMAKHQDIISQMNLEVMPQSVDVSEVKKLKLK